MKHKHKSYKPSPKINKCLKCGNDPSGKVHLIEMPACWGCLNARFSFCYKDFDWFESIKM